MNKRVVFIFYFFTFSPLEVVNDNTQKNVKQAAGDEVRQGWKQRPPGGEY